MNRRRFQAILEMPEKMIKAIGKNAEKVER